MTTRARHPTHTIKNIWDAEKKNNQKPLRGRAKRHSVTRNKRGEKKEKKKRKKIFLLCLCIYAGAPVMMMITHTKRKSLGIYQEKKSYRRPTSSRSNSSQTCHYFQTSNLCQTFRAAAVASLMRGSNLFLIYFVFFIFIFSRRARHFELAPRLLFLSLRFLSPSPSSAFFSSASSIIFLRLSK